MHTAPSRQLARTAVVAALAALPATSDAQSEPLMSEFMGINGHAGWTATDSITQHVPLYTQATRLVRDYHPMVWDISAPGNNTIFPMTTNSLNWYSTYSTYQAGGFSTNMDIQFEGFTQAQWPSMASDAYKYGRQVAQYFGPTGAGAGLVSSIEIGNEPGSYSDANYVTVVRNMSQGIRDYAPSMPIVSCNVMAQASGPYHKNVDLFRTNNMLNLVDVLSIHTYPMLTGWPTWERSYPEDPRLTYLTDVQGLIDWRDQYAPTKQVWVTEFGYDATTKPNLPTGTFKDIKMVTDKQQAQYLVRSYLAFAAMDVDRAYTYYYNDADEPTLHASSGLTRNFVPKPSYYAVRHMQQRLGNYHFAQVLRSDPGSLYIHSYEPAGTTNDWIWVVWSPTGSDRETTVTLDNLPGNILWIEQMPLADGLAPTVNYLTLGANEIQLTIGESPVYIHMVAVPEPTTALLVLPAVLGLMHRPRRVEDDQLPVG